MAVDSRAWAGVCQRVSTVSPRPSTHPSPWHRVAAAGASACFVAFHPELADADCHRSTDGQLSTPNQNSPQRLIHIQIHRGHIFVTSLRISRTHPSVLVRTRSPEFFVFLSAGDRAPPWSSSPWSAHPGNSLLSLSFVFASA